jgi:hypothetical protein
LTYPEHIEKKEFNKMVDEIKSTNIAQKMMQHVLECESCRNLSLKLNTQAVQHINELEKHV